MTRRRSRLPGSLALALVALAAAGCGGGDKQAAVPAAKVAKIAIARTGDALADAKAQ